MNTYVEHRQCSEVLQADVAISWQEYDSLRRLCSYLFLLVTIGEERDDQAPGSSGDRHDYCNGFKRPDYRRLPPGVCWPAFCHTEIVAARDKVFGLDPVIPGGWLCPRSPPRGKVLTLSTRLRHRNPPGQGRDAHLAAATTAGPHATTYTATAVTSTKTATKKPKTTKSTSPLPDEQVKDQARSRICRRVDFPLSD